MEELAIRKYGEAEYARKKAARAKREQNKRVREAEASEAAKRLRQEQASVPAAAKPKTSAAERKQLEKLRASLLRMCRKSLGHSDWRGATGQWRIECPNCCTVCCTYVPP